MMDVKDIKAMYKVEEGIINDPHLPRGKAISMLRRAHQQLTWLLERLEQSERERDEALARADRLQAMLDGFQGMQEQLGELAVK